MVQLFIVCALTDRPTARLIARAFAGLGYSVSPPALVTVPNAPKIHATAEEAKCVLVLWTHNSICSEGVCADAAAAAERHALVQVVANSDISEHCIPGAPTVDFVGWDGSAAGHVWANLLSHVKERCGPPPNPQFDTTEIAPRLLLGLLAVLSFALAAQTLVSNGPKPLNALTPESPPSAQDIGQTYNLPAPGQAENPAYSKNFEEGVGGPMVEADTHDRDQGKTLKGLSPRLEETPERRVEEPTPQQREKAEPEI